MRYRQSSFALFCFSLNLISLILPVSTGLRRDGEHVCQKITQKAYEKGREKCTSDYGDDHERWAQCYENLRNEWNTNVCCDGYVEVAGECKPFCRPWQCRHGECIAPGQCDSCSVNFGGWNCDRACEPGRFGTHCEKDCNSEHYKYSSCFCKSTKVTDECRDICKCRNLCHPGWIGKDCSVPCPRHSYGQLCSQHCTCVFENTQECNRENGFCTCKERFYGPNCELFCDPQYNLICPNNSTRDCRCELTLEQKYEVLNKSMEVHGLRIDRLAKSVDQSSDADEKRATLQTILATLGEHDRKDKQVEELDSKIENLIRSVGSLTKSVDQSTDADEKRASMDKMRLVLKNYEVLNKVVDDHGSKIEHLVESVDESANAIEKRERMRKILGALKKHDETVKQVERLDSRLENLTRRMANLTKSLNESLQETRILKNEQEFHCLTVFLAMLLVACLLSYLAFRVLTKFDLFRNSRSAHARNARRTQENETFNNPIYSGALPSNEMLSRLSKENKSHQNYGNLKFLKIFKDNRNSNKLSNLSVQNNQFELRGDNIYETINVPNRQAKS